MRTDEEEYIRIYPWKAKECVGCHKNRLLHKKYCDDCREMLADLPSTISKRFRKGEITRQDAITLKRRISDAKVSSEKMADRSCKVATQKKKVDEEEFLRVAEKMGSFTVPQISNELRITVQTAYKYLNMLYDDNEVEKEQCGKFIFWKVVRPGSRPIDSDDQKGTKFRRSI